MTTSITCITIGTIVQPGVFPDADYRLFLNFQGDPESFPLPVNLSYMRIQMQELKKTPGFNPSDRVIIACKPGPMALAIVMGLIVAFQFFGNTPSIWMQLNENRGIWIDSSAFTGEALDWAQTFRKGGDLGVK